MNIQDYIQTDGSDKTLQYGKNIDATTWEYMEWVDQPWDEVVRNVEFKLNNLDSDQWRKEEIDLRDYSREEILSAIETYGYKFENYVDSFVFNIEQSGYTYSTEESIQLACECIFEQEI